jgi:DNA/RNA-binding domain of Phe-tRNA-synthetase-like protein
VLTIAVASHALLDLRAFVTRFPLTLAESTADNLSALLSNHAATPFEKSDAARAPIRDLLRLGGYKPTGRGKPASEYLARAVLDGGLTPINLAVDACNVVSLHTGIPISVVDLDRAHAPFTVQIAGASSTYVFNASGQTIDLEGLLCLFDKEGPCANAVKDSQRTKTHASTRTTLSVLWNARSLEKLGDRACAWYRELLASAGATTEDVELAQLP